jgi:transposase
VRFIDAYVDSLNIGKLGFIHAQPKETGRPPYNPGDLLKLYIYGYLNRIRSSRELEKATYRNVEVMWLLRKLRPDFKTIADFRKENPKALRKVFREFTLLCKRLDLFGGELVAIDGSKFSAVNHNRRAYTKDGLRRKLKEVEDRINTYLSRLDDADKKEAVLLKTTKKELQEYIQNLQKYKANLEKIDNELEESGERQVSLTDPDSRKMQTGNGGTDVCYNVQMVVDDKHKLILDVDVTNDNNDRKQLYRMSKRTKEILDVEELDVVADMGYHNKQEIKKCQDERINCYIPEPAKSENEHIGYYAINEFQYDAQEDCYICPAKEKLTYRGTRFKDNLESREYASVACKKCHLRSRCVRSSYDRRIYRWVGEESIEEMRVRMHINPDKADRRKELVEHPFGTIKHWMNQGTFLMRGKLKVAGEICLSVLAYNIKRVLNIMGITKLIEALKMKKDNTAHLVFWYYSFCNTKMIPRMYEYIFCN